MKMNRKSDHHCWFLAMMFFFVGTTLYGQQSVSGIVTDANDGTPLIGVNVIVKGSATGTVTDLDGGYTLLAPDATSVFVFSYTGYTNKEVPVGIQNQVDVSLATSSTLLDQVVVIGYGTVKKSDLTGSVATISSKAYENQPLTRVEDALQGRAAGVTVAKANGQPGSNFKVRIRGVNSITGNNSPLVVVDGVQGGDLSTINPNDIETIDVLKDASATAIYGVRGSNGVIIITTKRGSGAGRVDVDYFTSFASVPEFLPTLADNPADFARLENLRRVNAGGNPNFTDAEISALGSNGGTNYQRELFRSAVSNNLQVSASGAEGNLSYFLSGNYRNQEGIVTNTGYKQLSLRSNLAAQVSKRLNIGLNLYATRGQRENDFGFAGNGQGRLVAKALTRRRFSSRAKSAGLSASVGKNSGTLANEVK